MAARINNSELANLKNKSLHPKRKDVFFRSGKDQNLNKMPALRESRSGDFLGANDYKV